MYAFGGRRFTNAARSKTTSLAVLTPDSSNGLTAGVFHLKVDDKESP